MSDYLEFETLFKEKLKAQNLSFKKLSDISGIAAKHIENLYSGRYEKLPPAPYLRGYLIRLGSLLNFDGEAWWEALKHQGFIAGSGPEDQLPKNRFARTPMRRRVALAVVAALVLLIFSTRIPAIIGRPALIVIYPPEGTTTVRMGTITVQGATSPGTNITVNSEAAEVDAVGAWHKDVLLDEGLNSIQITGAKFLGGNVTVLRQVVYEPFATSSPAVPF